MPVDGGEPRRLTWWGTATTAVLGWTADGRVLVASSAREANLRRQVVHAVGLDLSVERLRVGPAWGVAFRDDGATVLASVGSRPARGLWKRYRGGTAPQLWLDRSGRGTALGAPARRPGRRRWSTRSGSTGGCTSSATSPPASPTTPTRWPTSTRWTWTTRPPSRCPSPTTPPPRATSATRPPTATASSTTRTARSTCSTAPTPAPRPLDITLPGGLAARRRGGAGADEEPGRAAARTPAGTPAWWSGAGTRSCSATGRARRGPCSAEPGVRARLVRPLGATGKAVLVSDAGGEDALEVHALTGAGGGPAAGRRRARPGAAPGERPGRRPGGGRGARRRRPRGRDRRAGTVRDGRRRRQRGGPPAPTFSPDGRWLVWSEPWRIEGSHRLLLADLRRRPTRRRSR